MTAFFKKYISLISILVLLVVLWRFPAAARAIFAFLLAIGLIATVSFFVKKHKTAYLQGKTSRGIFVWNVMVEIFAILLAMTLASLLGRHIAQIATEQINNDIIKLIAGILIGLLVGIGVGLFVSRVWGKLSTKLNNIHQ